MPDLAHAGISVTITEISAIKRAPSFRDATTIEASCLLSAASFSGNINDTMTSLRSRFVPLVAGACEGQANDLDCCAGFSCKQGKCKP